MLAVTGKRTIENTLKPYDEMLTYLDAVSNQASLIKEVHPDEAVRTAAEKMSQKAEAFNTDVSLNRAVYDALAALDLTGADSETRYYVQRTLRDFRLAGVARMKRHANGLEHCVMSWW
jgi:thimet oligopeptidase